MFTKLSITQVDYTNALKNIKFSERELLVLKIIYHNTDHTATAAEVAKVLNPKNPADIVANGVVGSIGKKFASYLNIQPPIYSSGTPAYFLLVGPYYANEGQKSVKPGWQMQPELVAALEESGLVQKNEIESKEFSEPGEITSEESQQFHIDGKLSLVLKNKYERNRKARAECISHYGYDCYACGFSFNKMYGAAAENYIEVHHVIPLSEIKKSYKVNPIKDLIPLCSNCHSAIHLIKPIPTPKQFRELVLDMQK